MNAITSTLAGPNLILQALMQARSEIALLDWYVTTFVPDPDRGYALMNPPGADAKYSRKHQPISNELIGGALTALPETRRLPIGGTWQDVPLAIAVTPEHRDGSATMAGLDIDAGGLPALRSGLAMCHQVGLWAFAQASTSVDHDGGHLYIPAAERLPSSLLRDLSTRIQAAAHLAGEAYPANQDLRLPLMMHLRAPHGPERQPLILQDGTRISPDSVYEALGELQAAWTSNTAEAITAALEQLPAISLSNRQPLHKSKINPQSSASVIHWYNDNHAVPDLLASIGVHGADRLQVVRCPWHDDRSPSLGIWRDHGTGQTRCKCLSRSSACPAAERPYLDSFNVFCLIESLTPAAGVRRIAEDYQLGQRRQFKAEQTTPEPESPHIATRSLEAHQQLIVDARARLADELRAAAEHRGRVAVINATPGLGKTRTAALLTRELDTEGQTVAIVAASRQLAEEEWRTRIYDALVWQPRTELCTCYTEGYLDALARKGYTLPDCSIDCPYARQHAQRLGRIVIYQHAHLHLNDGELLEDADVVIVDESPLSSLLEEHSISQEDVRHLVNRLTATDDAALPLVRALYRVAHDYKPQQHSLRGDALREALEQALKRIGADSELWQAISTAKTSPVARKHIKADGVTPAERLPPVFFGRMLAALELGTLAWDGRVWLWYERNALMKSSRSKTTSPAVLVLDGSADAIISNRIYDGWPVDMVTIDAPISPVVRIVQCPITPSTRKIVQDRDQRDRLTRAIAGVCHRLGIVVDAGVSYMDSTEHLSEQLGGDWLHYGGQRGRNDLKDAKVLAIVASPTAPPDAIERKAEALWAGEYMPAIDCTWVRRGQGDYYATDPRLEAVNRMHGPAELLQAAHRCRPILSSAPTTLLICSPWNLGALGLSPSLTITEVPHGNSMEAREAFSAYQDARTASLRLELVQSAPDEALQKDRPLQSGVDDPPINLNRFVNAIFFAEPPDVGHRVPPPLSAARGGADWSGIR